MLSACAVSSIALAGGSAWHPRQNGACFIAVLLLVLLMYCYNSQIRCNLQAWRLCPHQCNHNEKWCAYKVDWCTKFDIIIIVMLYNIERVRCCVTKFAAAFISRYYLFTYLFIWDVLNLACVAWWSSVWKSGCQSIWDITGWCIPCVDNMLHNNKSHDIRIRDHKWPGNCTIKLQI